MPRILYFFESRLRPGTWCATTESNVKMWADEGYKVKKVVYEDRPPPSKPRFLPIADSNRPLPPLGI